MTGEKYFLLKTPTENEFITLLLKGCSPIFFFFFTSNQINQSRQNDFYLKTGNYGFIKCKNIPQID